MAYATTTTTQPINFLNILKRPFIAIWDVMVMIAENNPKMADIRALNAQTDEQLAKRGLTRNDEVRRIFGQRMMF